MRKSTLFHWLKLGYLSLALLAVNLPVAAQVQPGTKLALPAAMKKTTRVTADLSQVAQEYKAYQARPNARTEPFVPSNSYIQLRQGHYVVIDAVAQQDARALQKDLEALGAIKAVTFGRMVSAQIPVEQITNLYSLASMRFVRPAYKPRTKAGFVESQGDKAQRSDLARRQFKVNGKGVKVGVLSDSYNNLTGERLSILTGDLPGPENPGGFTEPVEIVSELPGGGTDEGRAIMEIIHDVAPGAGLAFHTAANGIADYALGILRLQEAGCQVIMDDIGYLGEPYFQDGIISQAIDRVVQKGSVYFSSAGNNDRTSYEKAFQPSGINVVEGEAHDFGNGNPFLNFTLPRGAEVIFILQWADPFFSISGGKGAQTDLDLYLVNQAERQIVAASLFSNIGNDPIEGIIFRNEGPEATFSLLIENTAGPDPDLLKIIGYDIVFPAGREDFTYSSTVSDHANARGAIAVGAARYTQTPAFGVNPPVIEPFSSAGGTPILFDSLGNRIKPVIRRKPEITAPDGVNTTFFIPGLDLEGDGFANFFGTSASAPHAAAVAALMLEATQQKPTPTQVRDLLQQTALDMDDPFTPGFDSGFDFGTGYGLIQADKAIEKAIQAQAVQRLVLVNADNGQEIRTLLDGDLINLAALPTRNLNIVAITSPQRVGSVGFSFNGRSITENQLPYALGGDFVTTPYRYRPLDPALMPGNYSLTATPYTGANKSGQAGLALSVEFQVVESTVESFTLVDAATHRDLIELTDLTVIDIARLPNAQVNIRANTNPERVGSVVFEYSRWSFIPPFETSTVRVQENLPPYALGGDLVSNPIRYRPLADSLFGPGEYVLKATTYASSGGRGQAGGTKLIRFSLINSEQPGALAGINQDVAEGKGQTVGTQAPELTEAPLMGIFPNPTGGAFTIRNAGQATVTIFDVKGQVVYAGETNASGSAELDISARPAGLYLVRVSDGVSFRTTRLLKR
jgi:subtilisin family serine protease